MLCCSHPGTLRPKVSCHCYIAHPSGHPNTAVIPPRSPSPVGPSQAECLTWGRGRCSAGLLRGTVPAATLPGMDRLLRLQHPQCPRLRESGRWAPVSHHFRYRSKGPPATRNTAGPLGSLFPALKMNFKDHSVPLKPDRWGGDGGRAECSEGGVTWGAGPGSEACTPHFLAVRLGKSLSPLSPSPPLCQVEGLEMVIVQLKSLLPSSPAHGRGEAGDLGSPCSLGDLRSLSPSLGLWLQLRMRGQWRW